MSRVNRFVAVHSHRRHRPVGPRQQARDLYLSGGVEFKDYHVEDASWNMFLSFAHAR